MFIGTYGGGVFELTAAGELVSFASETGRQMVSQNAMASDGERLYVGSLDGALVLDLRSQKWIRLKDELPSSGVLSVAVDDQSVYFGATGGIARIEKSYLEKKFVKRCRDVKFCICYIDCLPPPTTLQGAYKMRMNNTIHHRSLRMIVCALVLASFVFAAILRHASAQSGALIPVSIKNEPDSSILSLQVMKVDVAIDNQHARVKVLQIFDSHPNQILEGKYLFALPPQSSIADFAVWDGDLRLPGVILENAAPIESIPRSKAS